MPRILIADDDHDFCTLLGEYLQRQGFEVDAVHDGAAALDWVAADQPDALVLDVMMPALDGFQVLERLRPRHTVPVLMLTARGEDIDRIVGLEMGADDYLPKPANPRELLARLRAVLRRASLIAPQAPATERIALGDIVIEPGALRAMHNGAPLAMTGAEFAMLVILLREAGAVVGREQLCREALSRPLGVTDRSIDMHVSRLRGKLGPHPDGGERIRSVRNRGYCYTLPQ